MRVTLHSCRAAVQFGTQWTPRQKARMMGFNAPLVFALCLSRSILSITDARQPRTVVVFIRRAGFLLARRRWISFLLFLNMRKIS